MGQRKRRGPPQKPLRDDRRFRAYEFGLLAERAALELFGKSLQDAQATGNRFAVEYLRRLGVQVSMPAWRRWKSDLGRRSQADALRQHGLPSEWRRVQRWIGWCGLNERHVKPYTFRAEVELALMRGPYDAAFENRRKILTELELVPIVVRVLVAGDTRYLRRYLTRLLCELKRRRRAFVERRRLSPLLLAILNEIPSVAYKYPRQKFRRALYEAVPELEDPGINVILDEQLTIVSGRQRATMALRRQSDKLAKPLIDMYKRAERAERRALREASRHS